MNVDASTITNAGTISGAMQAVETDLNLAAGIGAAVGGPVGQAVAGGVQAVEGVVNTVAQGSPHQTALNDINNAVNAAAPVLTAVAGALPTTTATRVTTGLSLIQMILADIEAVLPTAEKIF